MPLDHARIQVTSAAGRDLFYGKAKSLQPVGIVLRLNVARQYGHTILPWQGFQGALQETGLAGTGRTYKVQAQHAMLVELRTQVSRNTVVLTQYFSLQRHSLHTLPPPDKPIPIRLH